MVRTLGPYEIRSKLGRGVAAVFWRAYDPALEREVALREAVIPADLDASVRADFVSGFLQRGQAAARLSHPGLAKVYSAEVHDGRPVLATEIVEGEALAHVLARGALSPSSAYYLLDQLLEAAAYAHGEGVVHEAISPDTVLVTREGRVKIADFGTAQLYTGVPTGRKAAVGPPGYAAPEQVDGGEVDHRADLFAIGVLGYEMLSGVNPFGASEGLSAAAISYRIVHEPPAPLPAEVNDAGGRVDPRALLGAALAKDPNRRFQSAEEFRAALRGGAVPAGTALLAVAARKPVTAEVEPVAAGVSSGSAPRRAKRAGAGWRGGKAGLGFAAAALLVACAVGVGLFFGLGGTSNGDTTTSSGAAVEATSSSTTLDTASALPSSTTVTLVPGTTTTTTIPPSTTTSSTSTTTTTLAPTTTTAAPTTTTVRQTTTTRRPATTTTRRPTTTTTQSATTTTTEFVTPTTLGPGQ